MNKKQLEALRRDVLGREAVNVSNLLDSDTLVRFFNREYVSSLLKTAKIFRVLITKQQTPIPRELASQFKELMDENPNMEFRFISPEDVGVAGFSGELLIADDHVFVTATGENVKTKHSNGTTAGLYRFMFETAWNQSQEMC